MGMQRTDGMQRMDFETLVQTRKSVRGFTKEPVVRAVIEDIIEVAKRAPSSMNTQPWHIHVLTGEPLEEAAWDRGLGSVINGQGIMRSDIVLANIPEDEVIMTCVAMGYPDDSFPANAVRSDREPNGDFVRFVGFSD